MTYRYIFASLLLASSQLGNAEETGQPVLGVRGVDDASARIMLSTHNDWRRELGLKDLRWSGVLAESAQAWSDQLAEICEMVHSTDRDYGENLAWSAGRRLSPDRVVNLWGHEKKHYDHKTNTCAENQICGHYTQIVWADTREVGCGHSICGGAEVWVCHYHPQGNIRGKRPY